MSGHEWEKAYTLGKHVNSWPWSDLVSLYYRYQKLLGPFESGPKVLELGPGTGNNFPFWRSVRADYFGIELSSHAIEISVDRYPELRDKLQNGDFSLLKSASMGFDVICDRASVTHCSNVEIQNVVNNSFNALKKGGIYLGIDWFSKNHSDFNLPSTYIDLSTKSEFMSGQFTGVGQVHFEDCAGMQSIFQDFDILELTEKIVSSHYPEERTHQFASWNIVARKPL
jgi:SAM-dependent methyltransferase